MLGEEPRPAYDRVALSSYLSGDQRRGPLLPGAATRHGDPARRGASPGSTGEARTVTHGRGSARAYDALVLATGSAPFVPPVPGRRPARLLRLPHHRRPRRDQDSAAEDADRAASVVGGGLLGLEAADALRGLGLRHARRRDRAPADAAARSTRAAARCCARTSRRSASACTRARGVQEIVAGDARRSPGCASPTAPLLDARPGRLLRRHQAARRAGPGQRAGRGRARRHRGRRPACRTSDPRDLRDRRVRAGGRHGLRAGRAGLRHGRGGRRPASWAAAATFAGADLSTKLKLLGVDVAQFGDACDGGARRHLHGPGGRRLQEAVHQRRRPDAARRHLRRRRLAVRHAAPLRRQAAARGAVRPAVHRRREPTLDAARRRAGVLLQQRQRGRRSAPPSPTRRSPTFPAIKACTRAGTTCGSCVPMLKQLLEKSGRRGRARRCASTSPTPGPSCSTSSRCAASRTFSELIAEHGHGPGLRHLQAGRRLDPRLAAQRARPRRRAGGAAGHQRPLPRQHPEERHLLGRPAHPRRRDHAGQAHRHRRGGPRLRPLHQDHRRAAHRPVRRPRRAAAADLAPARRRRVRVRPRLRQGAAHGEVVRRVRPGAATASRTPSAWPSTLELRYRGLRAPHKLKSAVSGCARECAEARSARTSAIIATEQGWNLYVGGNGGFTPRHADLLAADLSTEELVTDDRPVPHVLHPHRRPAAAHRRLARVARRRARLPARR